MRKKVIQILLCCFVAMFCIISCKKDKPVPPLNWGYNYFPNNVGHYVIYNCDSIVLDKFTGKTDTFLYQIKEVIDSIYPDNTGRPTQRIVRYKRPTDTSSWVLQKVWSGNLTTTTAERVEDNIRYVKLTFPVKANAVWNGNVDNTIGEWDYQYTALDVPATVNSVYFDSSLTVLQLSNFNGLQLQNYKEQYARNFGLIFKQVIDESADSIYGRYTSGVIYTETYVSSGN
jgi:hypothetical protein